MQALKRNWDKIALAFILLLAGFLSIYNIWNLGYSNEFYAASVKSMLVNWKNFFFASLDPGGWVTVDKPPVSLWVQAAFAKVLGFHGWSIILPECLAAVATTAIIFHVVKRHFGSVAGLVSALVLAISPIFMVVSKTNNTDSVLILLMVLSAWAMMVAADKGKLRYLILSAVILGIAYNAKTLEAFLILPCLYAVYFFATNIKWRKRIGHLVVATLVLAVVSLSWSVIVDLTPASERPYVDNSTTNSELELAIGYNGIQRITGMNNGSAKGGAQGGMSGEFPQNTDGNFEMGNPDGSTDNSAAAAAPDNQENSNTAENTGNDGNRPQGNFQNDGEAPNFSDFSGHGNNSGADGGMNGNSMFNGGGSAGVLRMFNSTLGGQDSWLLPFGFFSILALILRMRKSAGTDAETRKKLLRNVILWGGAVVTMFVFFDVSSFFHPYYISVMAPFLAALVGIGFVEMWKLYKEDGVFGFLLPVALAVTAVVQIVMLCYYPSYAGVMIPLVAVITGIASVSLFVLKVMKKANLQKVSTAIAAAAFAGLLVAPAVWTVTSVTGSINAQIPTAGPSTSEFGSRGGNGNMQNGMPNQNQDDSGRGNAPGMDGSGEQPDMNGTEGQPDSNISGEQPGMNGTEGQSGMNESGEQNSSETKLIDFLLENNTGEKYLIAVPSASEAEPIILETGKPVMAIGGFSGNDNTLSVEKLEQMVKAGEVKYFLTGGKGGSGNASDDLTAWVEANGTAVDQSEWSDTSSSDSTNAKGFGVSGTLYDLSSYKDSSNG